MEEANMKAARRRILLMLLISTPGVSLALEEAQMELRWDQLAPIIEGHEVEIIMQDGKHVVGNVSCVLPDFLVLKTDRTMKHVQRPSIATLRFVKSGRKWRWIGAAAGFYAVGVPIAAGSKFGGEALQGNPAPYAGAIAGYLIGRAADRRKVTIKILPD